ncbi:MAG: hypothetical protein JWO59_756 [Chloroflexi bacterium]|nr:hypothetical protein [Chloroflexota bacterium]
MATLTIAYNDPALTMAGYFTLGTQLSTPVMQWVSNRGDTRFQFTGTQLELQTANAFGAGTCFVTIDGGAPVSATIPSGSVQWVVLATGLADTTHTCVIARWNTSCGLVRSPMFRATGASPAFARLPGFEGNVTVLGPTSAPYIKPDSGVVSLSNNQGFPSLYYFQWECASITFRARCAGLKVYMFVAQSTYVLTIDGVDQTPVVLPTTSPDQYTWMTIATGLDDTAYHVYTLRRIYAFGSTLFAYQVLPNSTTGGDLDTAYRPVSPTQRVLGFGDSITSAYTATSDSRIGHVFQLAKALGQEGMNRGISGTTAHNFGSGGSQFTTNSGEFRVGTDVSSVTPQPTAVIDLYGTNDLGTNLPSFGGGATAETQTQFQTSLYNIYSNILTALPNCTILALGILDRSETMSAYNSTSAALRIAFNNAKAAAVAQIQAAFPGSHITYIDTTGWITVTPGAFGTASVDSNDGLHPNASGYTKIANKLLVYMRTRFRRFDMDSGMFGMGSRM